MHYDQTSASAHQSRPSTPSISINVGITAIHPCNPVHNQFGVLPPILILPEHLNDEPSPFLFEVEILHEQLPCQRLEQLLKIIRSWLSHEPTIRKPMIRRDRTAAFG